MGLPGIEPGKFSRVARASLVGYAGFRPWNAVSNLKDCLCAWVCSLPLDSCVHSRCQDGLLLPLISIAGLVVSVRSQFMLTAPATLSGRHDVVSGSLILKHCWKNFDLLFPKDPKTTCFSKQKELTGSISLNPLIL